MDSGTTTRGDADLLHFKSGDQRIWMFMGREGCMESDETSMTAFRNVADEGGRNEGRRPARSAVAVARRLGGVRRRGNKYISALLPVLC